MLPTWYTIILKGLSYLFQIFGLFLPTDCINLIDYEYKSTAIKQIYAVFLTVSLLISYGFMSWYCVATIFKVARTSSIILIILLHSSLTFICFVSILGNVFWNKGYWFQYVKLQKMLNSKLGLEQKRNNINFTLEFLLGHLLFILVSVVDHWRHWVYSKGNLTHFFAIVFKHGLFYYIFLITIIIYNMALFLRNNMSQMKTFLTDTVSIDEETSMFTVYKPVGEELILPRIVIGDETLYRLLEASKILNIIFECIEIFNRIFGVVILLMSFSAVVAILATWNTLLISGETNILTAAVVLNCLCEALLFVVLNSFIISACALLKQEFELVVKLCCKLQHILPQSSDERQELLNLAHQINRKSPVISAFGFFDVDFSLIFSIFSYVGTYIVALIQFSYIDF